MFPVEHQSKNPWLLRIWRNTPWLEVSIVIGVPQMDELFHGKYWKILKWMIWGSPIFRDLQLNFSTIFWNRQCLKMLQICLYDWNAPKHTPGHFRSAGELFGPHGIEYRIWNYVEDLDEGQGNPRRLLVLQVGKWKWRNENNMLVVSYVLYVFTCFNVIWY